MYVYLCLGTCYQATEVRSHCCLCNLENVLTERCLAVVYSGFQAVLTEPFPTNGHIPHNIYSPSTSCYCENHEFIEPGR
jgi:hypothetical protein